jgi:hypothetical protein
MVVLLRLLNGESIRKLPARGFATSRAHLANSGTLALPGEHQPNSNDIIEQQRHPADRPMSLGGRAA